MAAEQLQQTPPTKNPQNKTGSTAVQDFPWWLLAIVTFLLAMAYFIYSSEEYYQAFEFIWGSPGTLEGYSNKGLEGLVGKGIMMTLYITLVSFFWAFFIGLVVGVGRISKNVVIRNLATTYVEFIRGVPTIVLLFTLALVIVPAVFEFFGADNSISNTTRAIAALAIIYGAFLAEVFRAGIESVPRGQTEAAQSLGMSRMQTMRFVILPQAIRNVLPALGNDFIAMLKDSSLVTLLAVRDLTQQAKLYAGSSFRFRETYLVLTVLYLSMTLALSLILRWYENRLRTDNK